METQEIWKEIVGFEGKYEVSSLGRIKSLAKTKKNLHGSTQMLNERILAGTISYYGYRMVNLCFGATICGKKHIRRPVHQLVCEAFHGSKPHWAECVNHKDGVPLNNAADNLEWCTHQYNTQHAYDIGLHKPHDQFGERNPFAKLTDDIVREIRARCTNGERVRVIANDMGLNETTVSIVKTRRSWKHVQ